MPDIDLEPSEFRKVGERRLWREPYDPKLCRNVMVVALACLGYFFWHRAELTPGTLFGVASVFSFCAGGLFIIWVKDFH